MRRAFPFALLAVLTLAAVAGLVLGLANQPIAPQQTVTAPPACDLLPAADAASILGRPVENSTTAGRRDRAVCVSVATEPTALLIATWARATFQHGQIHGTGLGIGFPASPPAAHSTRIDGSNVTWLTRNDGRVAAAYTISDGYGVSVTVLRAPDASALALAAIKVVLGRM